MSRTEPNPWYVNRPHALRDGQRVNCEWPSGFTTTRAQGTVIGEERDGRGVLSVRVVIDNDTHAFRYFKLDQVSPAPSIPCLLAENARLTADIHRHLTSEAYLEIKAENATLHHENEALREHIATLRSQLDLLEKER